MNRILLLLGLLVTSCASPEGWPAAQREDGSAAVAAGPAIDTSAAAARVESAGTELPPGATELEIRFLDVGQGDGVLIRSRSAADGTERIALIDAGPADRIVGQLRTLGVESIDLMVASHNHADHIGGMDAILDSIPVRFYLDNGHPATTRIQERVLARVESRGVTYLEPTRRELSLGETRLRILPAPDGVRGEEQNNRSLTIVLEHGSFRALFTGDAETQLLNALLEREEVPRVDVLKASHHGSRNGVTPGWLARTRPSVVAISVGAGNGYGHPHAAAMRYYCSGGRQVLRTDLHGDIIVAVGAEGGYRVSTARGGAAGGGTVAVDGCAAGSAPASGGAAGGGGER